MTGYVNEFIMGATSVVKGEGPGEGMFTGILTITDLMESGYSTHAQPCLGAEGDAYYMYSDSANW